MSDGNYCVYRGHYHPEAPQGGVIVYHHVEAVTPPSTDRDFLEQQAEILRMKESPANHVHYYVDEEP